MPIPTALMGLLYPGPGDAPCDFDDQWCGFTDGIDTIFDRWEARLNRAYPAIAAAKMLMTEITLIGNSNPIPMTEVELDTAGMTNMDADPYGITVQRAGRYTVAGFLEEINQSGGLGAQSGLSITVNSVPVESNGILVLVGGTYRNTVYWPVLSLSARDRVTLTSFLSAQPVRTAHRASLSVSWHSDVERAS